MCTLVLQSEIREIIVRVARRLKFKKFECEAYVSGNESVELVGEVEEVERLRRIAAEARVRGISLNSEKQVSSSNSNPHYFNLPDYERTPRVTQTLTLL